MPTNLICEGVKQGIKLACLRLITGSQLYRIILMYVLNCGVSSFLSFLFLMNSFVSSHVPTSGEEWQLLARPVTHREFTEMAYLRPEFFLLGLKVFLLCS